MKPADVAPDMVFGCWRVIGPACPEFRNGYRYVEAICWSCQTACEVAAHSLAYGQSRRCKPCATARRWSRAQNILSPELLRKRKAQAERLALIRQVAERRQQGVTNG